MIARALPQRRIPKRGFLEDGLRALGVALLPGGQVVVIAAALVGHCAQLEVERDAVGMLWARLAWTGAD
jgi:hypothetical protein